MRLAFFWLIATLPALAADLVDGGWYDASLPVPVLHLEGSLEQVAQAHGRMVARHPRGKITLTTMSKMIEERMRGSDRLSNPILRALARLAYRKLVRDPMVEHVPDEYRAAYAAFAMASGVDEDDVLDALVVPDAALRAVSLLYDTELAPMLPSGFGCTSIIWDSGNTTALHGRNLDYDSVGLWDQEQLIMHVIPQEGLAHVALTALGIHATGITAFNEAGLTLSLHQLTLKDTASRGTPMPIIAGEVIRFARNVDEAINLIRSFPRAGGWAYVLSHGHDRAVVETSANELAVRRSSDRFFHQANHASSPALAGQQIFYSPGSWLDSFERAGTLKWFEDRGESKGWASPGRMAALLGSHEVSGVSRVAGGTIAKLDNIQSVIMDASRRRLWVAIGDAKHAPNEGRYIEYRWTDLRSAAPPKVSGATIDMPRTSEERKFLRQIVGAAPAPGHAPPASSAWSTNLLQVWSTWHELNAAQQFEKKARVLLAQVDRALTDPEISERPITTSARHRRSVARLFRARLLDLLQRRGEALYEYRAAALLAPFGRVAQAAKAGLRRAYDRKNARKLAIDWAGLDLYSYY